LHDEVSGRAHVASIYSVGLSHMNLVVQDFLRAHPKANVRIQYEHPHRVYELVENDGVDLGIVSYPKSSRTIKATVWREEPMVVVCAPQHALAKKAAVRLEDLHGMEIVAFDADLEIRHEIDRALTTRGSEVRVMMEFDNTETIKRAVEINAGCAILPLPTVEREVAAGSLIARPLQGTVLTRPIGIIQRRGKELGQTTRRFMQQLLDERPQRGADSESECRDGDSVDNSDWSSDDVPVANDARSAG
jgi:DNA-binding transcriptional LysR family regulator